jgi:ABC-type polysaccharide/polyol phosphate export permease
VKTAMQNVSALNIPQSGPSLSPKRVAMIDVFAGIRARDIWGRLGWKETKRRYRRTVFGPFWTTLSLAVFVVALGLVWSNLWQRDPKTYLPFLTSGMMCWLLFSTICSESCTGFIGHESLIKQLRISYALLACAAVWRNVIAFFHNIGVYVLICIYAGVSVTWATPLAIPGLMVLCLNCLWIAILLGTICARYRDVQQVVVNLLQISLFLTPIFWQADQLKGRASILAEYNPLYHLIAIVRDPLLGKYPEAVHWIVAAIVTLFGWALTIYVMSKFRHRIVYWL